LVLAKVWTSDRAVTGKGDNNAISCVLEIATPGRILKLGSNLESVLSSRSDDFSLIVTGPAFQCSAFPILRGLRWFRCAAATAWAALDAADGPKAVVCDVFGIAMVW
jgi:hypothetical protein